MEALRPLAKRSKITASIPEWSLALLAQDAEANDGPESAV